MIAAFALADMIGAFAGNIFTGLSGALGMGTTNGVHKPTFLGMGSGRPVRLFVMEDHTLPT